MIELAAATLRSTGRLRLRVAGSSMLPAILPGDVLAIRACAPAHAALGDVVLFRRDGRFFVHRVVRREGDSIRTRGDTVGADDPPLDGDALLGKVVGVERGDRVVAMPAVRGTLERLEARVYRHCGLAARLRARWGRRMGRA